MESFPRTYPYLFLILTFAFFFSCDEPICTRDFRAIAVQVLTTDGEPVVLDEFTVKRSESGQVIEICNDALGDCEKGAAAGYPEEGIYTIFHDGLRNKIRGYQIKIDVEGKKGEAVFQEEFVIVEDGCHVYKAAGPGTVFVDTN